MRKVLIISPHFPPINAADMHRVRQSLPYFKEMGWEPITLAVAPKFVEGSRDEHLLETIPADVEIHRLSALDYHWTRKFGLGSVALRSVEAYRRAGDALLRQGDIDLVYFSTTAFQVIPLGRYWKARFGVPYVIDMQDPWRSDHYLDVPPDERPPKFWLMYQLERVLEPLAMNAVDGIISVSEGYCDVLQERYDQVVEERCRVIPFGGAEIDFDVLDRLSDLENTFFDPEDGLVHAVYVGRGGHDMALAARAIFEALARGRAERPDLFDRVRMHFIGTDYAADDRAKKTLQPIAEACGVGAFVHEYPARVSYFTALHLLREADMLVLPGSTDPAYTASKLYPYILARRPLLAVFNRQSSVVDVLEKTGAGRAVTFDTREKKEGVRDRVYTTWSSMLTRIPYEPETDWTAFEPYSAREMTRRQTTFFDWVLQARTENDGTPLTY